MDWVNSIHGNDYIDIETDISGVLPFEDETFDTIICSDVLEHIWNPEFVLGEMKRICKKGGHIIINTPFSYWMHETPYDYHRYTPYFYEKYAEMNEDIVVSELRCIGNWREVITDIFSKVLQGLIPSVVRHIQKRQVKKCLRRNNTAPQGWTLTVAVVYKRL